MQLRKEAQRRGISPDRLYFANFEKRPSASSALGIGRHRTDAFHAVDTTTSDTCGWLPVLSLMGQTFASRVAGSLLSAVGLPELICANASEYEDKTVAWRSIIARLTQVRDSLLLAARDTAPLFDSTRFANDMGDLLQRMVERSDQGLEPAPCPRPTLNRKDKHGTLPHINLCIMQPSGYVHSLGFLDRARYFRHQFRRMGPRSV